MTDTSLVIEKRMELEREFFKDGVNSEMIRLLDRVEQMVGQAFKAGYQMAGMIGTEEWSNNACLGYAIIGAKKLKYSEDQTQKIVRAIYSEFDWKTLGEARKVYESSPY